GKLWHDQRLQFLSHELDLRLGERDKTPVLFPRLIKNLAKSSALVAEAFEICGTNPDRPARFQAHGEPSQMRGGVRRISEPPSVPIFRFRKATVLDQLPVVRRIVRGQDRRRKLETVDQ